MYTIKDIIREYERLDAKFNNNIANTVDISITGRCTSRRGCYKASKKNGHICNEKIIISNFVMNEKADTFYNTIRHEYAHALTTRLYKEDHGHDSIWKSIALKCGASANATTPATPEQLAAHRDNKYTVVCEQCGKQYGYQRVCRTLRIIRGEINSEVVCPVCGGKHFHEI